MGKTGQSYHHGALQDALLDCALDILSTQGRRALSLRAIARAAGVSQAAPYSHFGNRAELLAGVAQRGFQQLAEGMRQAEQGITVNEERLLALGVSYIRFAIDNPALYSLMFSSEFQDMTEHSLLAEAAAESYAIIGAAVTEQVGAQEAEAGTVAAWAIVHGVADLLQRGRLSAPAAPGPQREFIESILVQLF